MLRYACVEVGEGASRITDLRQVPLPPECFQEGQLGGPVAKTEAFQEQVRSLVEGLEQSVTEASLVLPDRWYRVVFAELDQLPSADEAREAALRWKLKRLVPFRVDELRIEAVEAVPLETQEEPGRVMIGFAIDLLLRQCEAAFAAAGVRLGWITNSSLAIANLIEPLPEDEVGVIVVAHRDGYSLMANRGESPVLYRYKDLGDDIGPETSLDLVTREMRLTGRFLEERLGAAALSRAVVVGHDELAAVVADAFRVEPMVLDAEVLFAGSAAETRELELITRASLAGAAHQEVA